MKQNSAPTRTRRGSRAGGVGIGVNLILSLMKISAGAIFGSAAVMADGFNNLADAASSVITFIGFRFSEKPADKEHPYGHARFEYLSALTVSVLVLVIGFELFRGAVEAILFPESPSATPLLWITLLFSIGAKLFLMIFFRLVGKEIRSQALLATAADSRNDVIVTASVLVTLLAETYLPLPFSADGWTALLVSLFVLYSGLRLAKKTVSPLLGESGSPELKEAMIRQIKSAPFVLDCHDLMIHDYGPGRCYASIHVEMDGAMDSMECHRLLDTLERDCLERLETHLVIHLDPVSVDDPEAFRVKTMTEALLRLKDERFSLHDFRMEQHGEFSELFFDLQVPEEYLSQKEALETHLQEALEALDKKHYLLHITAEL